MRLIFIRHGIAEDSARSDAERALTSKGKKILKESLKAYSHLLTEPDLLLSSPYKRAIETADIISTLTPQIKREQILSLAPDAGTESLEKSLQKFKDYKEIILVGHNPSMSVFISEFLTPDASLFISIKKGGIAVIEFIKEIKKGKGSLIAFLPPSILREIS